MLPRRLRISQPATEALKMLKARTGLTPNVVCRAALLLSLESGAAGGKRHPDQSGSEFNAPTLFGEYGNLFEALLLQVHGYLGPKELVDAIVSHIDDGLALLKKSRSLMEFIEHCGSNVHSS
jgi:DNA sulfur modification protein DndE